MRRSPRNLHPRDRRPAFSARFSRASIGPGLPKIIAIDAMQIPEATKRRAAAINSCLEDLHDRWVQAL